MESESKKYWLANGRPALIAGPCGAETREQVLAACEGAARAAETRFLRVGVWKPRTRPNQFEGAGEVALPWLREARERTGLPTMVEVASAKHVESALAGGVDAVWVGARTTVSPFAVQEIAEALAGTDTPILVKNPVNPDLALWLGAMERFHKVGLRRVGAIHRGFSQYQKSKYRNDPMWNVALEFRRTLPEVPLFCDPSHIAGKRELLFEIAQRALELDYDGLMLETHPTPDAALSDPAQQVTADQLISLLASLRKPSRSSEDETWRREIEEIREDIDRVDEELLRLVARRLNLAAKVGELKRDRDVAILQLRRYAEVLANRREQALELGLSPDFIHDLFVRLHLAAVEKQEEVIQTTPVKP